MPGGGLWTNEENPSDPFNRFNLKDALASVFGTRSQKGRKISSEEYKKILQEFYTSYMTEPGGHRPYHPAQEADMMRDLSSFGLPSIGDPNKVRDEYDAEYKAAMKKVGDTMKAEGYLDVWKTYPSQHPSYQKYMQRESQLKQELLDALHKSRRERYTPKTGG